eukprot:5578419-Prymnesium_polylepis.1
MSHTAIQCERPQSNSNQSTASAQAGYTAQNRNKTNQRSKVMRAVGKERGQQLAAATWTYYNRFAIDVAARALSERAEQCT